MSDDERLADQVMDMFVYAPIGLALEAKELLPKLADRGRGQVAITRLVGKVAADRGQGEARKFFDQVAAVVGTVLAGEAGDPEPIEEVDEEVDDEAETSIDELELPITDYDELSAPQLLPYLPPLSGDELDLVLSYEQTHRSRATVINRIRQLQA